MDIEGSMSRKEQERDTQRRIMKLVLVIFFVATLSAGAGFIRGEHMALQHGSQLAAATIVTITNKKGVSSKWSYDCNTKECIVRHVLDDGSLAEIYNSVTCTDGGCSIRTKQSVADDWGEETSLADAYVGPAREGIAKAKEAERNKKPLSDVPHPREKPFEDKDKKKDEKKSNDGSDSDNDAANAPKHDAKKCSDPKTANAAECRNKCSTTYVKRVKGQKTPNITDCGGFSGIRNNPIYKAIDALNACVQKYTGQDQQKQLDVAICRVVDSSKAIEQGDDKVKEISKHKIGVATKNVNPSTSGSTPQAALEDAQKTSREKLAKTASEKGQVYVPEKCLPLLKKVEEAKQAGLEKAKKAGSVAQEDEKKCTYHGLANCVFNEQSKKFDCSVKEGIAGANDNKPGENQTFGQCLKAAGANPAKVAQCLKNGLGNFGGGGGAGGGSPFGGGFNPFGSGGGQGSGGGSGNNTNQNQCPTGYKQSTENGRIVCTEDKKDELKPSCVLVVDKDEIKKGESVTLKWRTSNAEKVEINDVGDNIPKNSQKIIKPEKTTTYTLKATGKGSDNTKECTATVTVEGSVEGEGTTGSQPPKLSCSPAVIEQGKAARVRWACTTNAKKSVGENLNTQGNIASSQEGVAVRPDHNTQYSVTCLDEDDKELGKASCAVTVGKPLYDILVYPTTAKRGDRVRVSWASLFMRSCRVIGPRGFDFSRKQGVVITEPFALDNERVPNRNIRAAIYSIECESLFGQKTTRDVEVKFQEG